MDQCKKCKFSKNIKDVLCCKEKEVQICLREGGSQKVVMTSECEKVNLLDDCDIFEEKFMKFLMRKLLTPDHTFLDGVKDRMEVDERIRKIEENKKENKNEDI